MSEGKRVYFTSTETIDVDVDVDFTVEEVMEHLDDDDLIEEVEYRGYKVLHYGQLLEKQDIEVLLTALGSPTVGSPLWFATEKLYNQLGLKEERDRK